MTYPILAPSDTWYTMGTTTLRSSITEIEFVDSYTPTGNEDEHWDASDSASMSDSIFVYRIGTKLIIAGNGSGGIYANPDSSFAFSDSRYALNNSTTKDVFNKLTTISNLSLLDTSRVTDADSMFYNCVNLSALDVSNWDMSSCTDMTYLFANCKALTSIDVSNWDTSACVSMQATFGACTALTSVDISKWDTSSCTTMKQMFYQCQPLTLLDVAEWNTATCTDMIAMFYNCTTLVSLDVSKWNTSGCTTMNRMFYGCSSLTSLDPSNWDTSACTDMDHMFYGCTAITELDLHTWDVSKVTSLSGMFASPAASGGYGSTGIMTKIDVSNWDVSSCTNMSSMFSAQGKIQYIPIETWTGTSACTNMGWMFWTCNSLKSIDLSNFDTSNVISFHHLFAHDSALTEIKGLENLDVSNAITLNAMLHATKLRVLDISRWNTSKVQDMSQFVEYCSNLTRIIGLENIDTSQLKACGEMFNGCNSLKELNLSNFNTTNVNKDWIDPYRDKAGMGMSLMFNNNYKLERVILGENFSFNGDGTCTAKAILPTPNNEHIPNTKGLWYNEETLEQYESADIPNRTVATYTCIPINVIVKHDTLYDIATVAKKMTGTTNKLTPSNAIIAINDALENDTLYTGGVQAEYDRFWNNFQQNGKRVSYWYGFSGAGWTEETLKPKYTISFNEATNTTQHAAGMFYRCGEGAYNGKLESCIDFSKIQHLFDFSGLKSARHTFNSAFIKNLYVDLSNCEVAQGTFARAWGGMIENLTLKVTEKLTQCTDMFSGSTATQIFFTEDSVIACNGFDFNSCDLTKESLLTILNALADKSNDTSANWTITLGSKNKPKLTQEEIAVANSKGWSVA